MTGDAPAKVHRAAAPHANQCAALCFRSRAVSDGKVEVLLITSRETGRWVIPKGWSTQRKKPHRVARQEAWEEAGVRGNVSKKPFGHYSYEKRTATDALIPCIVQVHLLTVSDLSPDFPEKGQRRLRWCSPTEAAQAVHEPGLRQLFMDLRHRSALSKQRLSH
jgi:8-oxo-dGTP pyrophosphatase MutT (NUDIX family)